MLNRLNNAVLHFGKNATHWDNNQLFLKFCALTANVWGVALIKQWMIQLGKKNLVKYMDGNKSSCCICGRGYGWIFCWAWQWFERSHQSNGLRSAREKEDNVLGLLSIVFPWVSNGRVKAKAQPRPPGYKHDMKYEHEQRCVSERRWIHMLMYSTPDKAWGEGLAPEHNIVLS